MMSTTSAKAPGQFMGEDHEGQIFMDPYSPVHNQQAQNAMANGNSAQNQGTM